MQINGMLYAARLLQYVEFPRSEVLGPRATEDDIPDLIARHKSIIIKPMFKGGVGTKGKSGLIGQAKTLRCAEGKGAPVLRGTAPRQRDRQGERRHFEGGAPAEHEVYFSITDPPSSARRQ